MPPYEKSKIIIVKNRCEFYSKKNRLNKSLIGLSAEREGFEPPVRCRTTVFKTAAFDHSAISPIRLLCC